MLRRLTFATNNKTFWSRCQKRNNRMSENVVTASGQYDDSEGRLLMTTVTPDVPFASEDGAPHFYEGT
jgi:hypothetical protein